MLTNLRKDSLASIVVFLVAVPLCLGIALASGAPLIAGLVTGVIGGVVVGLLSGSQTSITGPAAGLTAVVAAEIAALGSFEAFLVAVIFAGVIQIAMGLTRAGFVALFIPSSVIKGLLAAIGIILIMKQVPHMLGHDRDAMGEMAFWQVDQENTLSELVLTLFDVHWGAALVGILSFVLLIVWDRTPLKKSLIPAPLVVVVIGVALSWWFSRLSGQFQIGPDHLVQVPVSENIRDLFARTASPDWSILGNPIVYRSALFIAAVASLETLLNIEAVDKLDPLKRSTPPNRELVAQGVGNILSGFAGGLPMTSVVIRGSVNIGAGGRTKAVPIFQGLLILTCVAFAPLALNHIPLSALAAILVVTGFKLASPSIFRELHAEGKNQFLPFVVTIVAIVFTDLLVGVLIGLAFALFFILHNNFRHPLRTIREHHVSGEVLRIVLANQVSFLNRGYLMKTLANVADGSRVVIDARNTEYIDADVLDLINEFRRETAVAHGVSLSLLGFKDHYEEEEDQIQHVDFSTREVQASLTPARVKDILVAGNQRFLNGRPLIRDMARQIEATAGGQFPMAVILHCIDSRSPAELLFDAGIGDILSARVAGNVISTKILGSMEFGCKLAGAKLIVVMGHTKCGAVKAAVDFYGQRTSVGIATGCEHLNPLVADIQKSIPADKVLAPSASDSDKAAFVDQVAVRNVERMIGEIRAQSTTLANLEKDGTIAIVGAMYNVSTGRVEFVGDRIASATP